MQILVSIGTMGASPQIGEILPPCDFFDCPVLSRPQGRLIQWARWARAQGPQASEGPQTAHALFIFFIS